MRTARSQPRSSAWHRPTGRPAAGRRPRPTTGRPVGGMSRRPASARKPSRTGVLPRRKQPPPSLASKLGQNAMTALKAVPATGAAKKAGQNKSTVALLAGLGAAGAAFLKRRRGSSDDVAASVDAPPAGAVAEDPRSVPVPPVSGGGAGPATA